MKTLVTTIISAILVAAASGQTSFLGVTPGKSTRSAVEQALGSPVKNVTGELAEYKLPHKTYRIYAQFRDGTAAAIVERIELTCQNCDTFGGYELYDLTGVLRDASSSPASDTGRVLVVDYYGGPRFIVETFLAKNATASTDFERRVGFYSRELFEAALPKGCSGTIFGKWETERGRVTFVRVGDDQVRGNYAKNNGTLTLKLEFPYDLKGYTGEWRDDTGSGTVELLMTAGDSFKASFTSGVGAAPVTGSQSEGKIGSKLGDEVAKISRPSDSMAPTAKESLQSRGLQPGHAINGKCVGK